MSKLYKKQIQPMIIPPAIPGYNCEPRPFHGEHTAWVDEEYKEDILQNLTEGLEDPMSKIVFVERYVEVELPEVEVLDVKPGDILCFKYNPEKCDMDTAWEYAHTLKDVFPEYYDKVAILLMPSFNPEIFDKETALMYIDNLRDEINKWED